ncbi:MAG: bifunctional UDP-3-O-[3-hydroxymyristoyl] N-acetylglucosamine deacetylase/3-hydroxyacyl-ACP dehydratase [Bacteroidia bacterium]
MAKQHTLKKAVTLSGKGLHTGEAATITFHPAPENHGYVFQRTDLEGKPQIIADVDNVSDTSRGTTLKQNKASISTVEHALASLAGLEIDNALIAVSGPEVPILDGSAREFIAAILEAGIEEQSAEREYFELDEVQHYTEAKRDVELTILPASDFHATVLIDFESDIIKPQQARLKSMKEFAPNVADSRTFCFLHELQTLHANGLAKGGDLSNAVVIVEQVPTDEEKTYLKSLDGVEQVDAIKAGILNPEGLRFENELARHKLLDLIGDLALVGMPLKGHVIANRPGHKANVELAKKIKTRLKQVKLSKRFQKDEKKGIIFDVNAVMDILPHRYPFLLVDKIVDFTDDTIMGVKNVTINEPFFQGHFPGNPIMPGVLQIEAMAQTGGILLLNTIENPQSVWVYIVAVDNARFKKPVLPGDTLMLELKMTARRRSICMMSGKVYVDGKVVCEADLVASVVPKN